MNFEGYRFNRRELAGALGDLGTFLPLAIALITLNGVNATSVFLAAGLLYIGAGLYFGIPMPVQPLKATSVIAIAMGASPQMIAATALSMGIILVLAHGFDVNKILDWFFHRPVIRGIQLSLGVIMAKTGFKLILDQHLLNNGPKMTTAIGGFTVSTGAWVGLATLGLILALKDNHRYPAGLVIIALGLAGGAWVSRQSGFTAIYPGWQMPDLILPGWSDFAVALPVLLLPQLPLTFANSIASTADASGQYFGEQAKKVTPRSLVTSLGIANLFSGLIGGIPLCHGAGGLTAHYTFGARTGGASIIMGGIFVLLAIGLGQSIPAVFNLLPLAVLGTLLVYIGITHMLLVKDIIHNPWEICLAASMGVITLITGNIAVAFALGVPVSFVGKFVTAGIRN